MVQGALACGETADCIRQELVFARLASEAAVRRRFKRAKAKGDLPADSNPTDLARYVVTISQGMAVQAAKWRKPAAIGTGGTDGATCLAGVKSNTRAHTALVSPASRYLKLAFGGAHVESTSG